VSNFNNNLLHWQEKDGVNISGVSDHIIYIGSTNSKRMQLTHRYNGENILSPATLFFSDIMAKIMNTCQMVSLEAYIQVFSINGNVCRIRCPKPVHSTESDWSQFSQ
jgi:hypothetical protein